MGTAVSSSTVTSRQTTMVQIASVKLEWSIENFDKLMKLTPNGREIVSQKFGTSDDSDIIWKLIVHPNGDREQDANCVSFFLWQVGAKSEKEPILTEFQILCSTPIEFVNVFCDVEMFDREEGRGKFNIPHEKVAKWLNADGSLHLICDIKYLSPNCPLDIGIAGETANEELFKSELSFKNLLDFNLLSDFVIKADEDKMFNCHRCVLASQSPVFRSMLENTSTIEARNGFVEITDCSASAIRGLLEFMYTGRVENLHEYGEDLLIIAEKYDVSILKELCERRLICELNLNNVCRYLIVADLHSADRLKPACLKFIHENHKKIIQKGEWKKLQDFNPHLASDILERIINGGNDSFKIRSSKEETKFEFFKNLMRTFGYSE